MMIYSHKECVELLDLIEKLESKLTDWERNFIDSVQKQTGQDRKLSIKQRETISKIWEKCDE